MVRLLYSDRAHTVLKSPWILGVVLKKSVDFIFPSKALKFLCKSLKSPWIFFNFECSELERILWCFLLVLASHAGVFRGACISSLPTNLSEGKKRRKTVTLRSRSVVFSLSTLHCTIVDWSPTTQIKQWERNVVFRWAGVCGEGRNTSSPKNACLGGYACPRQNINHSSENLKVIYLNCSMFCAIIYYQFKTSELKNVEKLVKLTV